MTISVPTAFPKQGHMAKRVQEANSSLTLHAQRYWTLWRSSYVITECFTVSISQLNKIRNTMLQRVGEGLTSHPESLSRPTLRARVGARLWARVAWARRTATARPWYKLLHPFPQQTRLYIAVSREERNSLSHILQSQNPSSKLKNHSLSVFC